jgi:tRNA A37 N6-isopentenylltransferase MiaA
MRAIRKKKKPSTSPIKNIHSKLKKKRSQYARQTTKASSSRFETLQRTLQDRKREVIQQIEEQLKKQLSTELQEQIAAALDIGDHSILDLAEDIDLTLSYPAKLTTLL